MKSIRNPSRHPLGRPYFWFKIITLSYFSIDRVIDHSSIYYHLDSIFFSENEIAIDGNKSSMPVLRSSNSECESCRARIHKNGWLSSGVYSTTIVIYAHWRELHDVGPTSPWAFGPIVEFQSVNSLQIDSICWAWDYSFDGCIPSVSGGLSKYIGITQRLDWVQGFSRGHSESFYPS